MREQGRIHDFKLGGALEKIAPSGGRRENCWGISCEKSITPVLIAPIVLLYLGGHYMIVVV